MSATQQDLFDKRRKKRNRKAPVPLEAQDQEALFRWAGLQQGRYPELRWMLHIPNGGRRDAWEGRALKRRGVRAGIPDVLLPAMRSCWGGLFIEMKREEGGRLTDAQRAAQDALRGFGYRVEVCEGWEAAKDVVLEYLALPAPEVED